MVYPKSQSWLPLGFEFLAGLYAEARRRRLLLTIQAYIDESGVMGTDPVFVLAGFIGPAERWARFSDEWKDHLHRAPSIQYLKMNEAVKLNGEFYQWKPEERDKKLAGFVDIIKRFRPDRGIFFMSDLIAWKQIMRKMKVKTLADPHFQSFNGIISGVVNDILDIEGASEELEIIFDENVIFGPKVSHWYPVLKEVLELTNPERADQIRKILPPTPLFRDDRRFLPLQASDILAWFLRVTFKDRIPGYETKWGYPKPTGFEWLAEELLADLPNSKYSTIWDHERIASIQELSQQMRDNPTFASTILKWQQMLDIKPE